MTEVEVQDGRGVIRVLLVDDQRMMREGLRAVLAAHGTIHVVGEAADGQEALEAARRDQPDVVVMDVAMKAMNGIEATRQILGELPGVRVLALSQYADRRYVENMVQAGARGYVLKEAACEELARAIEAVHGGEFFASPGIGASVARPPVPLLAPRERQVLQLIAEGHTSPEIGRMLSISHRTVEAHRRNIMKKLGLRTLAELVKWAVREGLTPPEP